MQKEIPGLIRGFSYKLPTLSWYIQRFIPKGGYLITGFADGGVGKSTFGAYLASIVTQRKENFLSVCAESSPPEFNTLAGLSGADGDRLYSMQSPSDFSTPDKAGVLESFITACDAKVVWIDALKSHFEEQEGDAQIHSRSCLAPLASMAIKMEVLIVGIFHTNKKHQAGGSTEMANVPRTQLSFERAKKKPLIVKVTKSNIDQHNEKLECYADYKPIVNPKDPKDRSIEILENGEEGTRHMWVIESHANTGEEDTTEEKAEKKSSEDELLWSKISPLVSDKVSYTKIAEALQKQEGKKVLPSKITSLKKKFGPPT